MKPHRPIRAYRCWGYHRMVITTPEGYRNYADRGPFFLWPTFKMGETTWHNRKLAKADRRPTRDNQHGLWTFKRSEDAREWQQSHGDARRWGSVLLWGKVVEHRYGYRAEFARIERVYVPRTPKASKTR